MVKQARMTKRHQAVQKCTPFDIRGGTKHCGQGESRFVAFHIRPFEMWTPNTNFACGVMCSWSTGRLGDVVHHHPSRKVPPMTTQEQSIWEKIDGNLACGMVQLRSLGSHDIGIH